MPHPTSAARDLAVRRLRRLNRGAVAATAVLIGVFSDVAAQAVPGHTVNLDAGVTPTAPGVAHSRARSPKRVVRRRAAATPDSSAATAQSTPPAQPAAQTPAQTPTPAQVPAQPQAPAPTPSFTPAPSVPAPTPAPAQTTSGGS